MCLFFHLCILPFAHVYTPTASTTTISSACPKCGTIAKSGKSSCCGRSGSWFENCGRAGNAKLDHTWYEGIQACRTRAQSKRAIGHQLMAVQAKGIDSSRGASKANSKAVVMASKTFTFMSANTSIPMPVRTHTAAPVTTHTSHTSVIPSITSQGCEKLLIITVLHFTLFININFIILI